MVGDEYLEMTPDLLPFWLAVSRLVPDAPVGARFSAAIALQLYWNIADGQFHGPVDSIPADLANDPRMALWGEAWRFVRDLAEDAVRRLDDMLDVEAFLSDPIIPRKDASGRQFMTIEGAPFYQDDALDQGVQ